MNILAVGWDAKTLRALRDCLSSLLPGSEIKLFTDPFWAVKYAYRHPVDMLFAETEMRGLPGSSVIRLVRARQAGRVRAFYVSGSAEAYDAEAAVVPADGLLLKPAARDRLGDLLHGAGVDGVQKHPKNQHLGER